MNNDKKDVGYRWSNSALSNSHGYLLPALIRILSDKYIVKNESKRIFDLGCGNGSVDNILSQMGWSITGIDASSEGITQANNSYPHLNLHLGSAYDNLPQKYGQFPIVISLEVIEHLYYPRKFAENVFNLLQPGGTAIISTPYHGYVKNLSISIINGWDRHFTALLDDGHIKFWSIVTLGGILSEAGLSCRKILKVGRISFLAKSMIVVATKS